MANYRYECGHGKVSGGRNVCGFTYDSPIPLSDFPWCPSESHNRQCDFVESRSTGVPEHVKGMKKTAPGKPGYKKKGGNRT